MIRRIGRIAARVWVAAALANAAPAVAALAPGAPAPMFEAPATQGGHEFTFSLAEALKRGPVVLCFYPAAFTAGCTEEAHGFARAMPRFQALGAGVLGLSGDRIETLARFSAWECAGRFPLASDPGRDVMARYDAAMLPLLAYAGRVSYLITPNGRVAAAYRAMDPRQHVARMLAALTAWRAVHPLS